MTPMFKKILLSFATVALGVAAAGSTHKVTLFQASWFGDTQVKPGEYKIEVDGEKAVIKGGKNAVETRVKVETNGEKYNTTSVRYQNGDGKYRVQEIRIGGTSTKLVFNN